MNTDEIYQFIKEHFDDEDGYWENAWTPFLTDELTALTIEDSEILAICIWDWEEKFIYKIADPILWCKNKFLHKDQLYCKVFSKINDLWELSCLAQNLGANLHDFKSWNSNLLLDIKSKLSYTISYISKDIHERNNIKQYQKIVDILDAELDTRDA